MLIQIRPTILPLHNGLDLCIESRSTFRSLPRRWSSFSEQQLNAFQSRTARPKVGEVSLDSGTETEEPNHDEDLVGDVEEGRGDEEPESKVEEPIYDGVEGHACCACLERSDFGGIDPSDRGEG